MKNMKGVKNVKGTKKGVAFSTLVVLALVGILLVSVWSYSQLATGSRIAGIITQRGPQDEAINVLELTKQFVTQNLKFAASSASVEVAANGGTSQKTYWYCNDEATPPQLKEVQFALSNLSLDFMNAYTSTLSESELKNFGVTVSPYGCIGLADPGKENCLKKGSSNCDSFTATATQGGLIEVSQPAYVSYGSDLASDVAANTFFNFYYKLYKDTLESGLTRSIAAGLRESCPGPTLNAQQRLQFALQKACDHYEALFEEPDGKRYVKCSFELLCVDTVNPTACTNVNCKRPEFNQQLCWSSASSKSRQANAQANAQLSSRANTNANVNSNAKTNLDLSADLSAIGNLLGSNLFGRAVKAQGGSFAGIEIIFHLTDTKFKVPSDRGLQDMVWNLYAVIDVANQECRPINSP